MQHHLSRVESWSFRCGLYLRDPSRAYQYAQIKSVGVITYTTEEWRIRLKWIFELALGTIHLVS
jgi:hypothetical protein